MGEKSDGVSWDDALSEEGLSGGESDGAEDPEQLRARIVETRAGMSETIDAISERLSPETLRERASEQVEALTDQAKTRVEEITEQAKDKLKETVQETVQTAKDAVYDSTIGKAGEVMQNVGETVGGAAQQVGTTISGAGSSAMTTIRRNPLPVALIGLGLGMLYLRRSDRRRDSDRYAEFDGGAQRGFEGTQAVRGGDGEGTLGRARRAVGDFAGGAQERVWDATSQTWDTVAGAAGQARDGVSSAAGQVAERASDLGGQLQQGARRVQFQYRQSVQENPLAVGAVALAAGAAVGMMLPSTRAEDRWMGETRENVVNVAEEAARSTIEKVQQVAGEAGRAARNEAEYQGLTGS